MSNSKHRRIVLIDHRFQLRLAGLFILVQVVLTGIFALGLYLFLESEVQAGLASAHAAYHTVGQMLMPIVLVLAAFSLAISTICVLVFVTVLSHKIAGPLYRFKVVLDELAARRIPDHTKIRPGDQLHALSQSFTLAVDNIEDDLNTLKDAAETLRAAHGTQDLQAAEPAIATVEKVMETWNRQEPRSRKARSSP
jgi:methyl-accepting chemotaxis protein